MTHPTKLAIITALVIALQVAVWGFLWGVFGVGPSEVSGFNDVSFTAVGMKHMWFCYSRCLGSVCCACMYVCAYARGSQQGWLVGGWGWVLTEEKEDG